VAFFGLYSLASINALLLMTEFFDEFNGCRGGFGGGGERVLFINLSDFEIDIEDEERNKTVFKLEFLFNDKVLFVVDAGNVDEPFIERICLRLETLDNKKKILEFSRKKNPIFTFQMFLVFYHLLQLINHLVQHHC